MGRRNERNRRHEATHPCVEERYGATPGEHARRHHRGPDGPCQRQQGEHIAQLQSAQPVQLAGGKKHHDPTKKKDLAKGVGKKQGDQSAKALAIKKASPMPISNKEAKRQKKGK